MGTCIENLQTQRVNAECTIEIISRVNTKGRRQQRVRQKPRPTASAERPLRAPLRALVAAERPEFAPHDRPVPGPGLGPRPGPGLGLDEHESGEARRLE